MCPEQKSQNTLLEGRTPRENQPHKGVDMKAIENESNRREAINLILYYIIKNMIKSQIQQMKIGKGSL